MKQIAQKCFPKAIQVTDRFHVQKLAIEALQNMHIQHRWEAIDLENEQMDRAKKQHANYSPTILANGDTPKQLLARSRYLLYKSPDKWTKDQKQRAKVLFDQYLDLKMAFGLSQALREIFNSKTKKQMVYTKLAQWYLKVEQTGFKAFNTLAKTIQLNYRSILNYFDNRSTNASAESFNAKIKAFRAQFRGVRNTQFFLFRLTQIFAWSTTFEIDPLLGLIRYKLDWSCVKVKEVYKKGKGLHQKALSETNHFLT